MRAGATTGFRGTALVAAMLVLGGCGGGSSGATETEPAPAPRTVIGHRIGPARVEPVRQLLPARPCAAVGEKGTATVYIYPEAGACVRVGPGERLRFLNRTGIGPRDAGATAVRVRVGGYELRIRPRGSGLIRAPAGTYLGRGSHQVRVAGAPGATVLLLPRDCAMHPPPAPGEQLCFR